MSKDVAEVIFEAVPDQADIIDILSQLVWMTPDNGGQICTTLEGWLISPDLRRAKIAVNFDGVFLWDSDAEMEGFLGPLLARFPSLEDDCNAARKRWRKQFPTADNGWPPPSIF